MIPIDRIKDLPDEVWLPIEGYDNKYLVSNYGRIKSLKRTMAKLLTAFPNNKGYYRVCLSHHGKGKHFLVSRIVAQAFCPNDDPEEKTTVDHIDRDVSNNRAVNLRWMSQQDNYQSFCEEVRKHNEEFYKQQKQHY